jgi:hypothetical protein
MQSFCFCCTLLVRSDIVCLDCYTCYIKSVQIFYLHLPNPIHILLVPFVYPWCIYISWFMGTWMWLHTRLVGTLYISVYWRRLLTLFPDFWGHECDCTLYLWGHYIVYIYVFTLFPDLWGHECDCTLDLWGHYICVSWWNDAFIFPDFWRHECDCKLVLWGHYICVSWWIDIPWLAGTWMWLHTRLVGTYYTFMNIPCLWGHYHNVNLIAHSTKIVNKNVTILPQYNSN